MKVAIRVAAFASFLLAGVLSILADRERWWPACGWGDFDSYDCVVFQDHLYDYVVPLEPWVPLGDSATLVGWSLLALAVAVVLIVPLAARPKRVVFPLSLFACSAALAGATTIWAGLNKSPVPESFGHFVLISYVLLGMIAIFWAWWVDTMFRSWEALPHHLLYISLLLTTGIPHYIFSAAAVGYMSHDRSPWDGAVAGGLFIVAGLICLRGFEGPPAAVPAEASVELAAN